MTPTRYGLAPPSGPTLPLLVFELDGQRCALPAADVREVVRAVATARLPNAPPIVEGVVNLRGTVVPVLDIRQRFRLPPKPLDPAQHFIVTRAGPRLVALRVDRALEVVSVPHDTIAPAGELFSGPSSVAGVARMPDGVLVIHDLDAFLSRDEDEAIASALSAAEAPQ